MDDSAFALDLLRTALVDEGFEVTCGRDLADLERLKNKPVDLILMDVEMPEAFGDDVVAWMLGDGLETPVYLLSNLPESQLAERARECGARGYIRKGIGIEAVVGRVHAILKTPGKNRAMAPALLIIDFLKMAAGRLRRAQGAVAQGKLDQASNELHTLAGEAGLLGLPKLAKLSEKARADALAAAQGKGSAASLHISIASVSVELAQAGSRARVPVAPVLREKTGRLLLLDDSDLYRSTLMGLLEDAGYLVVEARRLSEARQRMHDGPFDLAILDLHLEDGYGSDLIPDLRKHTPRTRLLLLSGVEARKHDADLMLPKSIDPGELLRRIDELLTS